MNSIAIRHYEPADYDMLCAWRHARGKTSIPEIFLPKCGVICERDGVPIASLFLHMSNSNGMCMAEHAASAPGLSLKTAREAFHHCMECLKKIAAELGYHTMAVFTYPGIARTLERQGFHKAESNLIQMLASTEEVQNGR